MTADLIAFLRARLNEDEAVAAAPEAWTAFEEDESTGTRRVDVDHSFERVVACTRAWRGVHIARHDPARVLAEVEAKRKVIHIYEQAAHSLGASAPGTPPHDLMTGAANTARAMLQALAAACADHPDYREEWRP